MYLRGVASILWQICCRITSALWHPLQYCQSIVEALGEKVASYTCNGAVFLQEDFWKIKEFKLKTKKQLKI